MNREENIFIAKRMLVDNIYRSAKLEGIMVTFAQTEEILDNINSANLKPDDITAIINLRTAWEYILYNLDKELDLGFIKECHVRVGHGLVFPLGEFRQSSVGISGTTWRPQEPETERLHQELTELKKNADTVERSIKIMLWIMRSQMFRDGNKRVAAIVANFEMIQNNAGIISIPENLIGEFKKLLVDFYETDSDDKIKFFIQENCVYDDLDFLSRNEKSRLTK